MADTPLTKPQCVVSVADRVSAKGRDPFAAPGAPGNRWLKLGCDGSISPAYLSKFNNAVQLAYQLGARGDFVRNFVNGVSMLTNKTLKGSAYIDTLNSMEINVADSSKNPVVIAELKKQLGWAAREPGFHLPAGFTVGTSGTVWIREFALKDWNEKQLAGVLSHEAAHVAGAPGHDFAEALLGSLYPQGYAPPEN